LSKSGKYLKIFAFTYLVFLYAPSLLLPIFSFNKSQIIAFPLTGFSFQWFETLLYQDSLHQALKNSLIVAISSCILATILGTLASRATTRYDFKGKQVTLTFILAPLILPEIIVGVSLLIVLIQLGITLNVWSVILGHTLLLTPFSIIIMNSAFNNLDISLEEASMDLGENQFGTFYRVILPLVFPGIIASLLIGFTLSLDEFIIAFFLTGTDTTLPVYIWSQFRFPKKLPTTMALGTILLIVSLILLSLSEYFRRRTSRSKDSVMEKQIVEAIKINKD
tara:strand:- start:306 stop:1142 length:837 start_codon:yes stop_codon:yes gene_type:complete